jgi:hypothetical protein
MSRPTTRASTAPRAPRNAGFFAPATVCDTARAFWQFVAVVVVSVDGDRGRAGYSSHA